jgi:hypothetical protein
MTWRGAVGLLGPRVDLRQLVILGKNFLCLFPFCDFLRSCRKSHREVAPIRWWTNDRERRFDGAILRLPESTLSHGEFGTDTGGVGVNDAVGICHNGFSTTNVDPVWHTSTLKCDRCRSDREKERETSEHSFVRSVHVSLHSFSLNQLVYFSAYR